MQLKEIKELLKVRYEKLGFTVRRIRKADNGYVVVFGEDEEGRGMGPQGLRSLRCNEPGEKDRPQMTFTFSTPRARKAKRGCL